MLQKIRWFLLLTGILIVVVISFQNSDPVELDLLFFRGTYSLTLLLLGTAAASFVFGGLMTAWMLRQRKKQDAKAKKLENVDGPASDAPVAAKAEAAQGSSTL